MKRRLASVLGHTTPGTVLALLFLVLVAGLFVPVPFAVMGPGPTDNTLGVDESSRDQLITITGRETYPTDGQLRLTTVSVYGRPDRLPLMVQAIAAWGSRKEAVVPIGFIYRPDETPEQVKQANEADMIESQENAKTAAMRALKIPVKSVTIRQISQNAPAAGKLREGDVVLAVDGKAVTTGQSVRDAIGKHKAGDTVTVRVRRTLEGSSPTDSNVEVPVVARPVAGTGVMIGVTMAEDYGFTITIKLDDIGGPSAGTMFALGIVDKLTPGSLTNGATIAGTGTIDADGTVGPIGGIQQKLVGAREAGATVFLTPADNCAEAAPAVPDGLRLVKITKLEDALSSLQSLRTGTGSIPSC